jgi:hypothetical protein
MRWWPDDSPFARFESKHYAPHRFARLVRNQNRRLDHKKEVPK